MKILKTRGLRIGCGLAILFVVLPIPKLLVDEWSVHVIDSNGKPVSGIRVSESWENYTFGISGGTNLYTNAEGKVVFPRQRKFGPAGYWAARAIANVVGFGVHAGFGSIGRVWISDPRPKDVTSANCSDTKCTAKKLESRLSVVWH